MGLIHTFARSIATVTTAQTLLQLEAGAAPKRCRILRAWINGQVTTDQAFEGSISEVTADGTGTIATVADIQPHLVGGNDATVTLSTTATMYDATVQGTSAPIVRFGASILIGWEWIPTPDEQIIVPSASLIALRILTTITTTTIICGITFEEIR